jgi:predicted ATPase/DNA-binding SARP family transcriptional activator
MINPGGEIGGPSIGLLGPLEVHVDGVLVALGGRQPRAVFTLLALSAGIAVPASRLVGDLWDDEAPRGAVNTVQVYVSRLRRALRSALSTTPGHGQQVLCGVSQGYLLQVPPEALDLHLFERHTAAGQAALSAGHPARAAAELRTALTLWRGPPLADLDGLRAEGYRARLEGLRLRALAGRLEADSALGQDALIVPELQELVRRYPLDERFVGQLMTALYRCGRQADALSAYTSTATRLMDELGVYPGPELRELHAEVLRHGNSLTPARRDPTLTDPVHRDPARPRTPLIGRQAELVTARALLATDDVRLVTIVGVGGSGKTRLALELVHSARTRSGDQQPAVVVSLDSVRDPDDLLPQIYRALGSWHGRPPEPMLAALAGVLAERPILLMLDGVERLIDAAVPAIADLLDAAPSLTVLATSRTALRLRGEYLLPLGTLPLPDAARLFRDRAAAVLPGFDITAANEADVISVCRMLDGLPLALELAAARIRLLPPAEMLRVSARLELLRGGPADLPERQRSMRALLDASVQSLGADELRLLGELSVFSGGWTLTAAEAICGDGGLLDVLERLVDRSLVVADGSGRFSMLGTVREYAAQWLAEQPNGESEAIRRRHAEHYAEYYTEWTSRLSSDPGASGDDTARGQLEAESANLNAAVEYARSQGEGVAIRGDPLAAGGLLYLCLGRPAEAGAALRRAAPLLHAAGQLLALPDLVSLLGAVALAEGDDRAALRLLAAGQAWRDERGLAVANPLTSRMITAATDALAAAEPATADGDRAVGKAAPFGSLTAVARMNSPDRPWLADLRPTGSATESTTESATGLQTRNTTAADWGS